MPPQSNTFLRILVFFGLLILNFGALAIGSLLMGGSPASNEWYISLNKAPWTPPGWVFGLAWTFVMICFTVYVYFAVQVKKSLKISLFLFLLQWALNIIWNPLFFKYHLTFLALIVLLTLVLTLVIMFKVVKLNNKNFFFILPYFLWLSIAISLNFYVLAKN
jgi:tryptophan-rich sensory protein